LKATKIKEENNDKNRIKYEISSDLNFLISTERERSFN